jgi:hypothetical protein
LYLVAEILGGLRQEKSPQSFVFASGHRIVILDQQRRLYPIDGYGIPDLYVTKDKAKRNTDHYPGQVFQIAKDQLAWAWRTVSLQPGLVL